MRQYLKHTLIEFLFLLGVLGVIIGLSHLPIPEIIQGILFIIWVFGMSIWLPMEIWNLIEASRWSKERWQVYYGKKSQEEYDHEKLSNEVDSRLEKSRLKAQDAYNQIKNIRPDNNNKLAIKYRRKLDKLNAKNKI